MSGMKPQLIQVSGLISLVSLSFKIEQNDWTKRYIFLSQVEIKAIWSMYARSHADLPVLLDSVRYNKIQRL